MILHPRLGLGWMSLATDRAKRVSLAFSAAAVGMVILTLWPYIRTREAPQTDGLQVAGFPFTFSRRGGFAPIEQFMLTSLLADVVIALIVCVLVAYTFSRWPRRLHAGRI